MEITIQFTGIAKSITRQNELVLNIPQGSTYRDILKILAARFPGLIGLLIASDGESFLSSNMFVINGDLIYPAMIMENSPSAGEHISLMSVITGG
ncbi:MAG: MoaD/ThiS family protein [Chloroflexi bacterium]|nr:MoaD/ThiS family protein [Chloroflexota bacterium]